MKEIMLFAAACVALAACTMNEIDTPAFKKGQVVTISASSEMNVSTKVTGTDETDSIIFKWETNDRVLVKVGEASAEFTLKTGAGGTNATFEGTMPADGSTFDMQYPVTTPDLSNQDYVSANQIPRNKMLFTAGNCTLGSNVDLKPQYAVLQLNLNSDMWIAGQFFKKIEVKEYDEYNKGEANPQYNLLYSLNIPDNIEIVASTDKYAPFYIVVNPGTYGFRLFFTLKNNEQVCNTEEMLSTSSQTFVKGECLTMEDNTIGCFAPDTRITMADGSFKKVKDIVEGDLIRSFDHETGCISSQKVCLTFKGDNKVTPLNLMFASGKTLSIVRTHDLLVKDNLKYVRISSNNVKSYVGKQFYNAETGNWDKLVSYRMGSEPVEFCCIYSAYHLNCIAEGMLTCPDDVDFLLNIYELDSNLKSNPVQLAADVQKYGLRNIIEDYPEYAEFAELWEELQFKYMNISLGKGLVTKAQLYELLKYWDAE